MEPSAPPYRTVPKARCLVPPPPDTSIPIVSLVSFVMTLITPFTALAPHSVAPGPLMTSIRSMSASGTSCTSQNTPEKSGV